MKKIFLLIPVLAFALMTKADVISITPTSPYDDHDNLRLALHYANDGDIIEMGGGTYVESNENFIAVTGKVVTVRAAAGENVLIQPQVPITVSGGGKAEFQGVKIDASRLHDLQTWYEHIIYATDATANNRIVLEGCEIYGFSLNKSLIYCATDCALDELTINNCYFHNIHKSCVFIANTTNPIDVTITNSTFANITTESGYSAGVIDSRAASGSFLVDHCTFYDVEAMNTDYAAIGKVGLASGAVVSNCIFALSASGASSNRTIRDKVAANNCLVYNYTADSGYGMQSNVTKTNCVIADPLFNDLANNKYTYAGNWITMELSPARGAATDGSDLGDPRWHTAGTLPTTDFASPYLLKGDKAKLSGNIWYDDVNDYLYGDGAHNKVYGTATWKLHAERACVVGVVLNLNAGNTSGHSISVEILDADGNSIGDFAEATSTLPGVLSIPAEGDYTIILRNATEWSSAMIDNITLSYIGGEVQNMPGTTDIADAWFSSNGSRADGKIDFPDGSIQDGWVKWNVSFASAANYNVTVNIDNENGHWYTVALYRSESDASPITVTEGKQMGTIGTLELGAMEVPAGNYIMKVTNATQYSDAKLISVNFAYAGGAAVDLSKSTPASLLPNADAILSDDWSIEDGKISYAESKATTGYAKWNVNCADYANYNVTVNISSDNGHGIRVEVFEDEVQPAIYTLDEPSSGKYHTGDLALDLGNILLADREYVVKITNTVSSSHAKIASIVITYVNGAQATLPATFNFEDGILSAKAHVTAGELWFNEIGDSNPVGQWAKWNVKAAAAGTFLFAMNVSSTNGQSYKISILDELENEIDAFESGSLGSGDKTFKHYFNLAAGNYIVKLENMTSWSQGHFVSLVVTEPSLLVLDEAAETNAVITENYRVDAQDIQIIRTIVAGMYNTICLPFDVSDAQLKAIFGSDVELLQMSSAEMNGDELDLFFEPATTGIYRGTPYLILTSSNVVNPIFTDAIIKTKVGDATSGTAADFIGTLIKGEVPAGENNLFLGPNDKLYFSNDATPIKGMRAWFQVKVPSLVIKRANIVTKPAVPTNIETVNSQEPAKSQKLLRDGQLIIIRDGVQYNAFGVKVK